MAWIVRVGELHRLLFDDRSARTFLAFEGSLLRQCCRERRPGRTAIGRAAEDFDFPWPEKAIGVRDSICHLLSC